MVALMVSIQSMASVMHIINVPMVFNLKTNIVQMVFSSMAKFVTGQTMLTVHQLNLKPLLNQNNPNSILMVA
jgi:hypothetical protein